MGVLGSVQRNGTVARNPNAEEFAEFFFKTLHILKELENLQNKKYWFTVIFVKNVCWEFLPFVNKCSPALKFKLLQASLLEEKIQPRTDLPPLLVHLHERRPEKLHYIGVSFGLTLDLFRFWRKHNFSPFFIGSIPVSFFVSAFVLLPFISFSIFFM